MKQSFSLLLIVAVTMGNVLAEEGHFHDTAGRSQRDPDAWRAMTAGAEAAIEQKQFDWALRSLNAALETNPPAKMTPHIYALRGDVHVRRQENEKARRDYLRALVPAPKTSDDYLLRGRVNEKIGRYKAAAADLAKAVELSPESASTLNALAWLQATCPEPSLRDGAAAVRASHKACQLTTWREPDFIDTLAAAHAEAGAFDQAVKYQEQAARMMPRASDDRNEMQDRAASYRQRKPYREVAKVTVG